MTDPRTASQELQAQILDSIRKSQDAVVDALRTWADAVHSVTPSLPVSAVPFADKLPKPKDLVEDAFDFAAQLLDAQRKFAENVLQITTSVAEEAPAEPAKKTAAAK
jgi:hypothetical protein